MINKEEYRQAKEAYNNYDINNLKNTKDITIGDCVINRYSCIQYHNNICKFLIFVLYLIQPTKSFHDLERLIEIIDEDNMINTLDKTQIRR